VPTTQNPRRRRDLEAQRKQEREAAQRAAYRRSVHKRRLLGGFVIAMVVVVAIGGVVMATSDSNKKTTAAPTTTALPTTTTSQLGSNLPPASLPAATAGATLSGDTPCPKDDGSSPRTTKFAQAPPMCIDPTKDYEAILHTTKGDISAYLIADSSPNSVNNFVTLARYHYYDGLPITRVVPRGWAEIGDPKFPDGTTGPGYTVKGEAQPEGSIPTPLIVATLPGPDGSSSGGLIFGLADQANAMPKLATQIGNISDSRLDRTKPPDGQGTVQHEIDKIATKSGLPGEVVTITGIDITELKPTS